MWTKLSFLLPRSSFLDKNQLSASSAALREDKTHSPRVVGERIYDPILGQAPVPTPFVYNEKWEGILNFFIITSV